MWSVRSGRDLMEFKKGSIRVTTNDICAARVNIEIGGGEPIEAISIPESDLMDLIHALLHAKAATTARDKDALPARME